MHNSNFYLFSCIGISPLIALKDFDIVNGFAIDYMHSILLGVVRKLLFLWFDQVNHREEYYIRKHTEVINQKIKEIKLPSDIQRRPRSLNERSTWKANELRSWFLFYGPGVLYGYLPSKYLNHFIHLISAVSIYLQRQITETDLIEAKIHITKFVMEFEKFYGSHNMVYNVHTLLHIPDCVKNLGPIWCYSNFPFENMNGKLVKYVKSPTAVVHQIASKYALQKELCYSKFEAKVLNYQRNISKSSHLILSMNSSRLLGQPKFKKLNLNDVNPENIILFGPNFASYERISMNNSIFSTKQYSKNKKTMDSVVKLKNNNYCQILQILKQDETIFFLVESIIVRNTHEYLECYDYFKIVENKNSLTFLVSEFDIEHKCFFFESETLNYIVKFDSFLDRD